MTSSGRRAIGGAAALCALMVMMPGSAGAATIAVDTTADEAGNADGSCSLREAARAADLNSNTHELGCEAGDEDPILDTIELEGLTYPLDEDGANEEDSLTGDLDFSSVDGPVEIVGTGSGASVIDASAMDDRVLDVAASLRLEGLTITGASPPDNNDGGAILANYGGAGNSRVLTLEDIAIRDNSANGPGGNGGGIQITGAESDDSLIITDSVISGNDSVLRGGGIDADGVDEIEITGSTLDDNTSAGEGGALSTEETGEISVIDSSITSGEADGGAGIHAAAPSGTIEVTRSVIADNHSISGGPGGGMRLGAADTTISDSVIRSNTATGGAAQGGGIDATVGSLTLIRTTVSDNDASFEGGGVAAALTTVEIFNSTVSGNTSTAGSGIDLEDVGGGSTASLVHVTVSGNTSTPVDSPVIRLTNGGAGLSLNLRESLIDETETQACGATGGASFVTLGFSVDRRFFCSDGAAPDTQNTDAQLQPLGAYGGSQAGAPGALETLPTHAIPANSAAVDEVPLVNCTDDGAAAGSQDQRGFTRPFPAGGACDAGAYEVVEPCDGAGATILGTGAGETINGSTGDDVISALGGNDTVNDLGGNDALCAGAGNDTVNGSAGNDSLDGGAGTDLLTYSGGAAVNASLTTGVATGQGTDALADFENLTGSAFADVLAGNALANAISGLAGADRITGLAGNDLALGGTGADLIKLGGGKDLLRGEAGNDRLFGGGGRADRIFGAAGRDLHNGGGGRRDLCNGGAGRDRPATRGCETVRKIP